MSMYLVETFSGSPFVVPVQLPNVSVIMLQYCKLYDIMYANTHTMY